MKKIEKHLPQIVFACFLMCFCLQHPLRAEAPGSWDEVPDFETADSAETFYGNLPAGASSSKEKPKVERTADGKYYLDFKAVPLINVLNVLSNLSGINFVTGSEVSARPVSMTLDNVTLEDALQAISYGSNVNYDFLPGRNIYLFRASADDAGQPPLITRVFKLYYVKVSKLKEIESDGGSSGESGGLTTLKVSEETEGSAESAIVVTIGKILSARGSVSVDDRSNSLIITDSEDRMKMIESALLELDRAVDQVLISVILVETFEDLDRNLGLTWGDADTGAFGTITGGVQATNFPFLKDTKANPLGETYDLFRSSMQQFDPSRSTGAVTTAGSRNFTDFTVTLQAMEDASKLKILAKPKILALDNQPALIKISTLAASGSNTDTTGGGSGTTTTSIERYEIGTILRVTPLINTGGRVTLTLEPTFATIDNSAIQGVAATSTGDPTTRTARTTMMVNDGQTIALGGMLFSNQSNDDRKVPFFGNIPVIGKALFTSNTKSIKDRELILFVTPYIITDPSMLHAPHPPDKRLFFDEETAPFWKVKDKQWYKQLQDGPEKKVDFDGYFNVRKRLMDSTLDTLDQGAKASVQGAK